MKRVELKRIQEFLWKGSSPDEKTPLAQSKVLEHGSIEKKLEAGDSKSLGNEFSEKKGDKIDDEGMSLPRKFCFVLSFNAWILYFLLLGWVIPCRNFSCTSRLDDVLEKNLTDIWLLTNMEAYNVKDLPSMAMIGYANGESLEFAALKSDDGNLVWNNSLNLVMPRKIQCNFEIILDVNGDGINDCLLSGNNDVYAFNASNGYVFWHQTISLYEGNIISKFHPTAKLNNLAYLLGLYGDKILVLNAENGMKVLEAKSPCYFPFNIRIVPSGVGVNITFWNLVCDYGDKIEVWSFEEQDLLNRENSEGTANDEFTVLLYRRESNSSGSIDLGCDVTTIPGGPFYMSWADRVVMVTPKAIGWERRFTYPLTVVSIKIGNFTKSKYHQLAVALRNDANSGLTRTEVHILNSLNGATTKFIQLKNRKAQMLEKITGNFDSLILISSYVGYSPYYSSINISDPIPTVKTNFALIHYNDKTLHAKDIETTSTVVGSAVNTRSNGEADLLIMTAQNGDTIFKKYIVGVPKDDGLFCMGGFAERNFAAEL